MSSQATDSLPSNVRTVTPRSSATVRSRTINADNNTGIASNVALSGKAVTGTSRQRVKNPTAMCAIGDSLMTTGDSVTTLASLHRVDSGRWRVDPALTVTYFGRVAAVNAESIALGTGFDG